MALWRNQIPLGVSTWPMVEFIIGAGFVVN